MTSFSISGQRNGFLKKRVLTAKIATPVLKEIETEKSIDAIILLSEVDKLTDWTEI